MKNVDGINRGQVTVSADGQGAWMKGPSQGGRLDDGSGLRGQSVGCNP